MKVGYLHIGFPEHGIRRYSQFLAAEARRRSPLTVFEATVELTEDQMDNHQKLIDAAHNLSNADVVHLQHNRSLWGGGSWQQFKNLSTFFRHCNCPIVLTLHDVYLEREPFALNNLTRFFRHNYGPYRWLLRWLVDRMQQVLVCTHEEAHRLEIFLQNEQLQLQKKLQIIPHFVEERVIEVSPEVARSQLNLKHYKVLTLLGWIHSAKGHEIMLEALPLLPSDTLLIFAGKAGAGCQEFVAQLQQRAEELGVSDRLRITGYLTESELEQYLVSTDLAVCPFYICSASGSLSTWISIARPILASHLPQITEYNLLQPGAIHCFQPYTPAALATAIQQLLPTCTTTEDPLVSQLREQLNPNTILDRHLTCYQNLVDSSGSEDTSPKNTDLTTSQPLSSTQI